MKPIFLLLAVLIFAGCAKKITGIVQEPRISIRQLDSMEVVVLETPYVDTASNLAVFYDTIPGTAASNPRPYIITRTRDGLGYIEKMPGNGIPAEFRITGMESLKEQQRREREIRKEHVILTATWTAVLFIVFGLTVNSMSK